MTSKKVIAASVARLLASAIPFNEIAVVELCGLLVDDDPAYRLAALRLLMADRMPNTRAQELARHLTNDPHHAVNRSARTIVDKLEADGNFD